MLDINGNELIALKLVLEFIPTKELLSAAMNGFSEKETTRAKDNADLCFKAVQTFLK